MIRISLNAFLSLRSKLSQLGRHYTQDDIALNEGTTVLALVHQLGLDPADVEAAFVNGKVMPKDIELKDGDRVALVPPGTPGPHRYLLGISGPR